MTAVPAQSILKQWDQLVAAKPAAVALIDAGAQRAYTRAEIDAFSKKWTTEFSVSVSSIRNARIGFALPNGASWLAAFLGILRTGSIALPIDASEPVAQQRALAAGARGHFWWTGEALERLGGATRTTPPDRFHASSTTSARGAFTERTIRQAETTTASGRFAKKKRGSAEPAKDALSESLNPLCLIKLTSGSTGRPRALVFHDSEMIADGRAICATMGIRADDINLGIIPFGHSYGLGNLVMPLLIQGTAILCVSAPLPHAIAENCLRWHPTIFPAVPALLRLLTLSDVASKNFASLRTVISAGSLLSADIARAFCEKFQIRVHSFYGSSETGGICYDRSGDATLEGRSVGRPLEGVRLVFQRGQRFIVESPAVFIRGGRRSHRPADRGELNEVGELRLLGRAGRMMKIAGRRIDLTELETTVRKLSGIRDAFFTPHPRHPEELAGAVATDLDLEAARAVLRKELAAWKVPKKLIALSHFPITGRGKPDTTALRKLLG